MTIRQLLSGSYYRRHTRGGGYPIFMTTFCETVIINHFSCYDYLGELIPVPYPRTLKEQRFLVTMS